MYENKAHLKLSARGKVYEHIKNRIINLDFKPGEQISEKVIAENYNVSRTPVREAFLKLSEEELIYIYPQRGTVISKIDLQLVEEGRFFRENIERAIVKNACYQLNKEYLMKLEINLKLQFFSVEKGSYQELFELDKEFHRLLFEGCRKIKTWKIVRQMNTHFDRLRILRLASNHDWRILVDQHYSIFEAISRVDLLEAENIMKRHLKLVHFETEELTHKYPNYFK